MRLSKRLEAVASYVMEGARLADIGTDHGYVPIYLMLNHKIIHGIAMDVRSGPLDRAKAHIEQYGLADRIETRLSDGLLKLQAKEADTVVIAGIGGELMIRILEEGRHVWDSVTTWILSPQSDFYKVRYYLQQQGFCIKEETMLMEEGKYYTVMQVVRGTMAYQRTIDFRYGNYLLTSRHPILRSFLEKEIAKTEKILMQLQTQQTDGAQKRREELLEELKLMKEAFYEMQ